MAKPTVKKAAGPNPMLREITRAGGAARTRAGATKMQVLITITKKENKMTKWADYLVSAVRYVETKTTKHISQVRVHVYYGETLGDGKIWSRQDIINAIDLNSTFCTTVEDQERKWMKGAKIDKIKLGDEWFIKTESDKIKKDNLENLPEF